MNAGVPMTMLDSANAELAKALSIPVPGAVVIAPLTQSWRNYGSAGGEFTRVGSPTISANGISAPPGTGARIETGWSTDFTTIFYARMHTLGSYQFSAMLSTMQPINGVGGWGYTPGSNSGYFSLTVPGFNTYPTTKPTDLDYHVFTLQRNSGVVRLLIDGEELYSSNQGNLNGTRLVLGGIWLNGVLAYSAGVIGKNLAQYHTALSSTDRALVEAWAAA